ncbi:hypothetical protein BaRGS_00017272 [Batillaria attramentaria]|uniref:Uncharacterized protein n=1 Tax=Batillaria attramentaria TaxID=370345 RepID=A0ABD0KWA1_9CAEN
MFGSSVCTHESHQKGPEVLMELNPGAEYGLSSYGGASLTHHALQFSIQGGPNFVVSQAGRSMHRADLDPPPLRYNPATSLHQPGLKSISGNMAHASLVEPSPVDLSTVAGHKLGVREKDERRHYGGHGGQPVDMVHHHYQRPPGCVTIPDQSHGNPHDICESPLSPRFMHINP